ncbi:hypothetical protein [Streptomyces sp. NPDC097619]|uniref:hypothetical protein n=1 Tax=Streptomyces sp. NPDC097619 TaxID=3157228 RepID=UPI00332988E1
MREETCAACGGTGLTDHTEYSVATDDNGHQRPVVRRWIGACRTCHGTGSTGRAA